MKHELNKTGSVLIFLAMTAITIGFFYVVIANGTPQEEHVTFETGNNESGYRNDD